MSGLVIIGITTRPNLCFLFVMSSFLFSSISLLASSSSLFFLLIMSVFADAGDSTLDSPGEYKIQSVSLRGNCLWWLVLLVDGGMIMKSESSLVNTMVEVQESNNVSFSTAGQLWPKKLAAGQRSLEA
jgi:hypothetical protein